MAGKITVLVVDDEPVIRAFFAEILRGQGYTVWEGANGREGLALAKSKKPDLVLLDVRMPDLDGFEVCRRIKKDPALSEAFVVLVSGKKTDETPESWGLTAGADDYISKPVAGHEFLARVRFILRFREITAALRSALDLNQTIMGTSPIGIMAYDSAGQCVFANRAASRITGVGLEDLLGENLKQPGSWRVPKLLSLAEDALKRKRVQAGEFQVVNGSGKKAWLDLRINAFSRGGQPHLLMILNDVTDRKRMEQELHNLPNRIIQAQEAERSRVARELHDGVNQILASAKMRLRRIVDEASESLKPSAREILLRCDRLLVQALEENRRIAQNLRPTELDTLGLAAACKTLCDRFATRTTLTLTQDITKSRIRFSPGAELNIFRILQEALTNIEKHAGATRVWVRLGFEHRTISLAVIDDGRGLRGRRKSSPGSGLGLTNIRERAAAIGGTCEMVSKPAIGTTLTVSVPFTTEPGSSAGVMVHVLKTDPSQPSRKHNGPAL